MGLFDFLKKKNPVQYSPGIQQGVSAHVKSVYEKPTHSNANQEVSTKTPLVEISTEQDGPIPLSILIKSATPSKQGLYPHEIMMLEYAPHFKTSNNGFQNFWYWQYSVTDPQSF